MQHAACNMQHAASSKQQAASSKQQAATATATSRGIWPSSQICGTELTHVEITWN
jgi:hypothetical protein